MHAFTRALAGALMCLSCRPVGSTGAPAPTTPAAVYEQSHLYPRQYAVVIGVNSYHDDTLKYANVDACRMAHYLREQGSEVVCCFRSRNGVPDFSQPLVPTADGLRSLVERLDTRGSRFFLYFSGHSRQVMVNESDGPRAHTLLLMPQPVPQADALPTRATTGPYAAQCANVLPPGHASEFRGPPQADYGGVPLLMHAPNVDTTSLLSKVLSGAGDRPAQLSHEEFGQLGQVTLDLGAWFRSGIPWFADRLPLSTVLAVDGCDLGLTGNKGLNLNENPDLVDRSTLWLLASRSGQATYELKSGQGLFTAALLSGLSGAADSRENEQHLGLIHGFELEAYLKSAVPQLWQAEARGGAAPVPRIVYHNPGGPDPGGTTVFVNPANLPSSSADVSSMVEGPPRHGALATTVAGGVVLLGSLGAFLYQDRRAKQARSEYADAELPDEALRLEAETAGRRASYSQWGMLGGGLIATGGVVWLVF